jgi:ABC-type transport system involved in multi-copper enzyme maturation permease subunit
MTACWVVAALTFKEAARKKILWVALLFGVVFLVLFSLAEHYQTFGPRVTPLIRRQILNTQFIVALYAVNFLVLTMTVLTSVDTLSGEIASGTIHAVATKPIRRQAVLIGKWLGFTGMITLFLALMVGGLTAASYGIAGYRPHHVLRGFGLMWLESILLLSVSFLFGTMFSTLTNGIIALGLHGLAFLGGWVEQLAVFTDNAGMATVGVFASILMPSEALWRRAAFEMQSPLVSAIGFSPFGTGTTPSGAMISYAAAYVVVSLFVALRMFSRRDL